MIELEITGMNCQHCVSAVTEALASVDGVTRVAAVEIDPGRALIEGSMESRALVAAVEAAGYGAKPVAV